MKIVSFSQYESWLQCPLKYKLDRIDKLKPKDTSIHLIFGNAVHETIQTWLTTAYTVSVKKSDMIDLGLLLKSRLMFHIADNKKKLEEAGININQFLTPQELTEFLIDGVKILEYVKKKRTTLFPSTKHWELVKCELRLDYKITEKIKFQGYIDIIFKNKSSGDLMVIDLKTSGRAWSEDQKKDPKKRAQLWLYKKMLCELYKVPMDKIEVMFIVLKRKVSEHDGFPEPRTTTIVPPQSARTVETAWKEFVEWTSVMWNDDGTIKENFPSEPKINSLCRFCSYNNTPHCSATYQQ